MTIGERLRRERTRTGLTQVDLATRLGVSREYVVRVEHNMGRPSQRLIERWAAATGAGTADLVLDGPALFDVTFGVADPVRDPFVARRVLGIVPPHARRLVAVWPAVDGSLRLRARASALPLVIGLTGASVDGIGELPAPMVRPVAEASELTAWLRASSERDAIAQVDRRLAACNARGSVTVAEVGRLFVAVVAELGAAASIRLQDLVDESPLGLFVPNAT